MAAGAASAFPEIRLTMTDLDSAMIDSARTRLASYPHVSVRVADVTSLPLGSGSLDAVTSYLMLHHVIDWEEALAEIARVLRPRGTFLGYDLTSTRLARAIHKADGSPHRIIAPDDLADGLADAGFAEIAVRPSMAGHLMRFRAHKPAER